MRVSSHVGLAVSDFTEVRPHSPPRKYKTTYGSLRPANVSSSGTPLALWMVTSNRPLWAAAEIACQKQSMLIRAQTKLPIGEEALTLGRDLPANTAVSWRQGWGEAGRSGSAWCCAPLDMPLSRRPRPRALPGHERHGAPESTVVASKRCAHDMRCRAADHTGVHDTFHEDAEHGLFRKGEGL